MDRNVLIRQLQNARELEDKFILGFDEFLKTHVSDNYHLTDAEKAFVDKRIRILLEDSKRHLNLFATLLGRVERDPNLAL